MNNDETILDSALEMGNMEENDEEANRENDHLDGNDDEERNEFITMKISSPSTSPEGNENEIR